MSDIPHDHIGRVGVNQEGRLGRVVHVVKHKTTGDIAYAGWGADGKRWTATTLTLLAVSEEHRITFMEPPRPAKEAGETTVEARIREILEGMEGLFDSSFSGGPLSLDPFDLNKYRVGDKDPKKKP